MKVPRTVGAKIFVALTAIVSAALVTTYLMVVPTLDSQLVSSKLDQLERSLRPMVTGVIEADPLVLQLYVENTASAIDARVVVFEIIGPPNQLLVQADSFRGGSSAIAKDAIALEAVRTGSIARGTLDRNRVRRAEVAARIPGTTKVVLLSTTLRDAQRSVTAVRKRLMIAALPSLLIAMVIGLLGARTLTRRIRRLEDAANRIAGGELEEPIRDEAEDEIGQLTRSFERMRLRLAQLEEARKEFIANASHELRTPIFALSGSLELLAEEKLDEGTRREFLESMSDQVERLKKLAGALLDLSRLDAGKLDLDLRPLALATVAESLRDEFAATADITGHPLTISVAGDPVVIADEQRTLQTGRVLVENAFIHTPSGVPVSIRVVERAGRGVLIVEDAGPGIPPEYQQRVFERFFRVEGEKSSGSGLGLAIAREWAVCMGGDVKLESKPGATVFSLELPLVSSGAVSKPFSRENDSS